MSITMQIRHKVELNAPLVVRNLTTAMQEGDSNANAFVLEVYQDGKPFDSLSDFSLSGYMVRSDGIGVPLTGEIEKNTATVVLPAACYRVSGFFAAFVRLTSGDGVHRTITKCTGTIDAENMDGFVDEEHVVPTLDELLAKINEMEAATSAATSAASAANKAAAAANATASRSPYIGPNRNWWIWSSAQDAYVDSGNPSRGEDGTSFTVLGLYASLSELRQAHPTASAGDAYAVGTSTSNVIYIWDVDASDWVNLGELQGPQGEPGRTPERGVDYWTNADKQEIIVGVLEALPNASGVSF